MEGSFAFITMKRRLEGLWARAGPIQVSDIPNNYFLVRFSDMDDYQRAAFGGPWKIAVTRIGNAIGKTVRIDLATKEGARARFARVCVEIDLSKPLIGKYIIDNRTLHVEYESLENLCVSCGIYGHKVEKCPTLHPTPQADPEAECEPSQSANCRDDEETGTWMIVGRRKKKNEIQTNNTPPKHVHSGSRFDPLSLKDMPKEAVYKEAAPTPKSKSAGKAPTDPYDMATAAFLSVMNTTSEAATKQNKQSKDKRAVNLPRAPLGDISNAANHREKKATPEITTKQAKSMKKTTPEEPANLVSIPVTYQNPIFQSTISVQPSLPTHPPPRPKTRNTKPKAPPPSKSVPEHVRRFIAKAMSMPLQQETKQNTNMKSQDQPMDADKPPDQRC
ncbi:hypothetical protein LINPERPRIM_LOCUS39518 [Linum perenne]